MISKIELKKLSYQQLGQQLSDTRARLLAARFRAATGNLQKSHQLPQLRQQIARILTFMRFHEAHQQAQARTQSVVNQQASLQQARTQIIADNKAFRAKIKAQLAARQQQTTGSGEQSTPQEPTVTATVRADEPTTDESSEEQK